MQSLQDGYADSLWVTTTHSVITPNYESAEQGRFQTSLQSWGCHVPTVTWSSSAVFPASFLTRQIPTKEIPRDLICYSTPLPSPPQHSPVALASRLLFPVPACCSCQPTYASQDLVEPPIPLHANWDSWLATHAVMELWQEVLQLLLAM